MTRFARAGKRRFVEASSWNDLAKGVNKATTNAQTSGEESFRENNRPLHKKQKRGLSAKTKEFPVDPKRQKQIEARRLRRKKWKCCFICRQPGHKASECQNKDDMKIGTCFKCGSNDHTTRNCKSAITSDKTSGAFPFAKCFICQEMGHLARSCPENPRGLYPQGGGCKMCGSVEHLKRDCPQLQRNKKTKGETVENISLTTVKNSEHLSADAQEEQTTTRISTQKHRKKKRKIVKF